jgi:peptidoglycan lytic transglycosylase D
MRPPPSPSTIPVLSVRTEDGRAFTFSHPFQIGREQDCDVRIEDGHVSRHHATVAVVDGRWQLRDELSANGVFVDGQRVQTLSIEADRTIRLGADGPRLTLEIKTEDRKPQPVPVAPPSESETVIITGYANRYFGAGRDDEPVGERTVMIRKAFQRVQNKQRRLYIGIIAVVALAAVSAAGYAYYKHRQLLEQEARAEDLFYEMKRMDVDIANLEQLIEASGNPQGQEQVKAYLARRRQMESDYDRFVAGLKIHNRALTEQERLILRVTRTFGEYELGAPPDFLAEVSTYIRQWRSTNKYADAIDLAKQRGYVKRIASEFENQNLPPHFFYLALQESSFNEVASGPRTYAGIAKGMWQFIPETAQRYGLKVGPLKEFARPDPGDERHHWEKATRAAAKYIKEIYSTDAQASGLLVMASYNWGEGRVIRLLRSMPENPRERNFWKVLQRHRQHVPKETYDYVLSIVAAAVIGENPKLFGLNFDNPLADATR